MRFRQRSAPFALTIFVSAFLLFQVQPLIAKQILPWFGGSAAVWTTCMFFFQIALLLGYSYAHWLTAKFDPQRQMLIHAGLLCASILSLPIVPNVLWKPSGTEDPLLRILGLLAATIGLPYFLLSSTSPLLQAWMSRAGTGTIPYRFFALSNLGSMLALLSYPILVEPLLTNRQQAWTWTLGYVLFAALCGYTAHRTRQSYLATPTPAKDDSPAPTFSRYFLWIALSASASALLLSVTTHLTENVASIPFLWILPLALYLLTFILCFEGAVWYQRIVFLPLAVVSIGALAWGIDHSFGTSGFREQIAIYATCLFVCCMVCHGELSRTKPAARYLTGFYLMVSLGGAIGGLFVAYLAPRIFTAFYEFPIALVAATLTVLAVYFHFEPMSKALKSPRQWLWFASFTAAVYLCFFLYDGLYEGAHTFTGVVLRTRNFYGALRIDDSKRTSDRDVLRTLTHGTINHGEQFLDLIRRREPATYFGHESGIGLAINDLQATGPLKVGIIGLGTGTIAAYSRPFDTYRYYEINPLVIDIAHKYFFYLDDSKANLNVELGDARLTLERQNPQNFDILAVDAFSSDAIPVHLLTNEAFKLYWKHLKPTGILAVHISNRYLDLSPVVQQEAKAMGKPALLIASEDDPRAGTFAADWVLVTTNPSTLDHLTQFATRITRKPQLRLWTDDYSNLWQVLK